MFYFELIEELIKDGHLKTPEIIEAFKAINRADFLPEELRGQAGINAPLLIGQNQTISQPLTVAFMLELLEPKAGEKILDIGSGSGWQTAIIAYIVSQPLKEEGQALRQEGQALRVGGQVFAIERISELAEFGKNNINKYDFIKEIYRKHYESEALHVETKIQVITTPGSGRKYIQKGSD